MQTNSVIRSPLHRPQGQVFVSPLVDYLVNTAQPRSQNASCARNVERAIARARCRTGRAERGLTPRFDAERARKFDAEFKAAQPLRSRDVQHRETRFPKSPRSEAERKTDTMSKVTTGISNNAPLS